MNAHILTIGDEILIGQVTDTNSAWIAQRLNTDGIWVSQMRSIGDKHDEIVAAFALSLESADLLFITGGLGPTKDDITKKAIADFFGVEMVFHDETWARIQSFFQKLGKIPNESHRNQCLMPANALILTNEMGTAPAMWIEHNGKIIVSMPGVPYEMKYLMDVRVLPKLRERFKDTQKVVLHRTLRTAGAGETELADLIADLEDSLPEYLKIAYLPDLGQVRLRLTATGDDVDFLEKNIQKKSAEIEQRIQKYVFGYEGETLETALGKILVSQNKMLVIAESCTGGYIAHRLTSNAGASAYFKGGVVAYSNELKINQLGVLADTIDTFGAVSEQTVIEMARGALLRLNGDAAIAVSGIVGPDGGTPEKPVGTVWIAYGDAQQIRTLRLNLSKDRLRNIQYTATVALNLLRRFLLQTV